MQVWVFPNHRGIVLDERNVFDDDEDDVPGVGEQPEKPRLEASSQWRRQLFVIETPRERMLKRLNALRIVRGSRPPS